MSRAVQEAILRVDKDQPISDVSTMDDIVATSVARPRFRAVLVGAFAAVALLLASIGVFGVMAFSVAQRTREFGVRMALGALARQVMVMVAWHGLQIALAGTVAGLCAAIWLTRYLQTLLFQVVPADPLTFVAAPLILICLALLACVVPARRASASIRS
jgi:putative ABC transport system permease protein